MRTSIPFRKSINVTFLLALISTIAMIHVGSGSARADGGTLQTRRAAGSFEISLFTASQALAAGNVDLSVLVQDRTTGDAILDGAVTIQLTPIHLNGTGGAPITVVATHKLAANKLLYATLVNFPSAGEWRAQVIVRRASESASIECMLPVAAATSSGSVDVLIHLLIVFGLVSLFILHQWLLSRPNVRLTGHRAVAVNET